MRTVKITAAFGGYPSGSGKRHEFAKGEEVSVPAAFAETIVAKGLAKEVENDKEKAEAKRSK